MMNQRLAAIGGIGTLLLGLGSGPTAGAPTLCLGEVVTIEGTDDDDRLRGTPGDDVISAGQGWDVIAGLGGNDAICGGGGADRVRGGGGDDQLHGGVDGTRPDPTTRYGDILTGGSGDDVMDGGEGKGSDRVTYGSSRRSIRLDLSTGVATGQGTDTLVAIDNAKGSPFGDHMVAGKAMSFLNGGLGNDRLVSAGGPSFVLGGGGEDHLRMPRGGIGIGGNGDDLLVTDANGTGSTLYGDAGADTLIGRGEVIVRAEGGSGNDRITTGKGDDELSGDAGDDALNGRAGNDEADGGSGTDTCRAVEESQDCER